MLTNVLVGMKSGLVSLRKPRSMPLDALSLMVVWVMKTLVGSPPLMRMAASLMGVAGYMHESLPEVDAPPANSTMTLSRRELGAGIEPKKIPSQSPAAGAASAEVKRMGLSTVPTA